MLQDIWDFVFRYIFPIAAIIAAVFALVHFYKFIKKKIKKKEKKAAEVVAKKVVKPTIVQGFVNSKLKSFLDALRRAVPAQYVIYPHVNAEMLFSPNVREDMDIDSEYCDFVIFNKDFIPILAIDMIDITISKANTGTLNDTATKLLKQINVPVLKVNMQEVYNIDQLRLDIANILNPVMGLNK